MYSYMFILIYFLTLRYAGAELQHHLPKFLKEAPGHEEYIDKEGKALKNLVATEDVIKYWKGSDTKNDFGHTYIVHPDGNGTAKLAVMKDDFNKTGPLQIPLFSEVEEARDNVVFGLYNNENPNGVSFKLQELHKLNFPKKDGVKVIIHGWRGNGQSEIIQRIKSAYLEERNVNVVGVDWSFGADSVMYNTCAKRTQHIGKIVGELIEKLSLTFEVPYEDFHLIGHSLGAHIAGFAGRHTKSRVSRITGLDPALPGFQYLELAGGRLYKTDARFVDIIHTCVSALGMSIPIGQVDFYPNGGSPMQPGCDHSSMVLDTVSCSHSRSYQFFEESIRNQSDFVAVKCSSWAQFKERNCSKEYTHMGDKVEKNAQGTYYLKTNERTPFYLGMKGTIF